MKKLFSIGLLAFCFIGPAQAFDPAPAPSTQQQTVKPSEADLQTHDHYVNSSGAVVHSPSKSTSGKAPDGATAKCRDGSWSFSQHHRGTCSHHGGVDAWQ